MKKTPETPDDSIPTIAKHNPLLIDSVFSEDYPKLNRGDFQHEVGTNGSQSYFWLVCPKCAQPLLLALKPVVHADVQHSWSLSGTIDKPTLEPSIDHKGCWHGLLTNGNLTTR